MQSFDDERNSRQIALMKQQLDYFEQDRVRITDLIRNLKGLFWEIEGASAVWKEDFLSEWGALEAANALELSRNEQNKDQKEILRKNSVEKSDFILQTIARIKEIVDRDFYR